MKQGASGGAPSVPVERLEVLAYKIPVDGPGGRESDGTLTLDARLLDAGAIDCLQADVTQCGRTTGLLQVAGFAAARQAGLSAHCAPAVSAHAFCAVERVRHLEHFHDHVRIESMLFAGTLVPVAGALRPHPAADASSNQLPHSTHCSR